jgi:hypothetical protein
MVNTIAQQDSLVVKYDTDNLEVQQISEEDIKDFRNDPKFNYEVEINKSPSWWNDFKTWIRNLLEQIFEWIFGVEAATDALLVFFRILPYILLALLLFLLIRFFINVNSSSAANSAQKKAFVGLSEEEHIIKNEDIQMLIKKALEDKNYRLAIRYYYLFILQLMSEKEIIDWQLQKTNHDYENEIKKPNLKEDFTKITRLYDYVWYGDFEIDEPQYQKAEYIFSIVQKTLKK